MAIALDAGVPDYGADKPAGTSRLGVFKRQRDGRPPDQVARTQDSGRRHGRPDSLAWPPTTRAENVAAAHGRDQEPAPAADFDASLVKESFAHMMANSGLAMEYFYSHLFIASPETRGMFPMGMSQMRERLFAALARLVWSMDSPEEYAAYLAQLGRDHRKYGVKDKHYHAFFSALLETVASQNGSNWAPETEAAWQGALAYAARMMRSAAAADAEDHPPWWVGEIVGHDRRGETVAVVTIRPDKRLPYLPGQYLTVQVTRWPRVWRAYSIANAPRADGTIDLHVRAVPGGLVSNALVRHAARGDTVLLGPASGQMTVPDSDRDLLCVAGGTGLAPIKAIIEATTRGPESGRTRRITLFAGARQQRDLYDLADLQRLQAARPGVQVIPVLSEEPGPPDGDLLSPQPGGSWMAGMLPDVVRAHGLFENSEAFICGPDAMVAQTALLLAAHVAPEHIHHDPLPPEQSRPSAATSART